VGPVWDELPLPVVLQFAVLAERSLAEGLAEEDSPAQTARRGAAAASADGERPLPDSLETPAAAEAAANRRGWFWEDDSSGDSGSLSRSLVHRPDAASAATATALRVQEVDGGLVVRAGSGQLPLDVVVTFLADAAVRRGLPVPFLVQTLPSRLAERAKAEDAPGSSTPFFLGLLLVMLLAILGLLEAMSWILPIR